MISQVETIEGPSDSFSGDLVMDGMEEGDASPAHCGIPGRSRGWRMADQVGHDVKSGRGWRQTGIVTEPLRS